MCNVYLLVGGSAQSFEKSPSDISDADTDMMTE